MFSCMEVFSAHCFQQKLFLSAVWMKRIFILITSFMNFIKKYVKHKSWTGHISRTREHISRSGKKHTSIENIFVDLIYELQGCSQSVSMGGGQTRFLGGHLIFKPPIWLFFLKFRRKRRANFARGRTRLPGGAEPPWPPWLLPCYEHWEKRELSTYYYV